MEIPVVTPMKALYRTDQPTYQPTYTVPMHCEDGNPQASLENLKRLKESKLIAQDIWVRNQLRRVLFQFATGEQYLAARIERSRHFSHSLRSDGVWRPRSRPDQNGLHRLGPRPGLRRQAAGVLTRRRPECV